MAFGGSAWALLQKESQTVFITFCRVSVLMRKNPGSGMPRQGQTKRHRERVSSAWMALAGVGSEAHRNRLRLDRSGAGSRIRRPAGFIPTTPILPEAALRGSYRATFVFKPSTLGAVCNKNKLRALFSLSSGMSQMALWCSNASTPAKYTDLLAQQRRHGSQAFSTVV